MKRQRWMSLCASCIVVVVGAMMCVSPTAAAMDENTPPTALPLLSPIVNPKAEPIHIDLHQIFSDREDKDRSLTYTLIDNSNPALVTMAEIDAVWGCLTLTCSKIEGDADITVMATDTGGLSADTVISVLTSPAITPKAIADISVDVATDESVIDLSETFPEADLTFEVTQNTNPDLFTEILVDDDAATLTLVYSGIPGTSVLTVQAENADGDLEQDTFIVNVLNTAIDIDSLLFAINAALAALRASSFSYGEIDFGYAGGDPCFIATAAYGTPLDARIDSLREFRDDCLFINAPGTALAEVYYRISPAMAHCVANHPLLAALVRVLLSPIVAAVRFPAAAGCCALALVTAVGISRRRTARAASR